MNKEISTIYNKAINSYSKSSYTDFNILFQELYLMSLSMYLKNILKDKRTLTEIKDILQDEIKDTLYYG